MVDINKLRLKVKKDSNWLKSVTKSLTLTQTNTNSKNQYFEGYLFYDEDKESCDFDDERYLLVKVTQNEDHFTITLEYSMREWYFGISSNKNFTIQSLNACIILLSERLSIPKLYISNGNILKLSLSTKIAFEKRYHNFMNCILEHKQLKNISFKGKTTVRFSGKEKKLTIKKERSRFTENKNNVFYVNFTIGVKNISNNDFLNKKAKCPKDISRNWDSLTDMWKKEFENLIIVNNYSPEISDYLENSNMTKMNGYLVYVGIKHYGLDNFRNLINNKMTAKKLYEYRNKYISIYEQFENMNTLDYRSYFKNVTENTIR